MNVRSVTVGLPLSAAAASPATEATLIAFLDDIRQRFVDGGQFLRTTRLTLSPIGPAGDTGRINAAQLLGQIGEIDEMASRAGLRWINVPFDFAAMTAASELREAQELALTVISRFPRAFINLICARDGAVYPAAVKEASRLIKRVSQLDRSGFVNFRVGATLNAPPNTPFFPFSYSCDEPSFSLGLEMLDEVIRILHGHRGSSMQAIRDALLAELTPQLRAMQQLVEDVAGRHPLAFRGLDISLAPFPQPGSSVAGLIEMLGEEQFGGHGTAFVTGFLTDLLRTLVRDSGITPAGFCGVMLSLLEDDVMGQRNNTAAFSIDSLLLYSTVCGCGLDMIPLPGDVFEEEIAAMILDTATISAALGKPLGVRLLPIPTKQVGELTEFNMDFLFNTRVCKTRNQAFWGAFDDGAFRFATRVGDRKP